MASAFQIFSHRSSHPSRGQGGLLSLDVPPSASLTWQSWFSSSDPGRRAPKMGRGSQGRQLQTAPHRDPQPRGELTKLCVSPRGIHDQPGLGATGPACGLWALTYCCTRYPSPDPAPRTLRDCGSEGHRAWLGSTTPESSRPQNSSWGKQTHILPSIGTPVVGG